MASKKSDSVVARTSTEKASPARAPAKGAERTELRVLASRASLHVEDRRVLATQTTDEYLEELGGETRSPAVLSESRSWIVPIDKTLVNPPDGLFYGDENFTYMLECIANLHDTMEAKKDSQSGAERARGVKEANLQRLRRQRNQLIAALSSMARGNTLLENEITIARGAADSADAVLSSTRDVIKLARRWLREEPRRARLAKLSEAVVESAEAAVNALAEATDQRREDGKVIVRDDADTNLAEGRVLFQMKLAMRAFENARDLGAKVPKLIPGAGTKRVLSGKPKVKPGEPGQGA